jgi:hypothetical protein
VKVPQTYLICDFLLRTAAILTAVAVTVATLGIPLPLPLVKDANSPFPCMNCGCGCVNADMCWRQCCCYTNTQKLAWANKHGVKVPNFVLEQVAGDIDADTADLAEVKPCCRQRVLAAKLDSCGDRDEEGCKKQPAALPPVVPGVLAFHALKCQGLSLSISLLPPSVPTDEIGTELPLVPGGTILLTESTLYQPPTFDAVVPPPEFAAI